MAREEFVSVNDIAEAYHKSIETVRRWCRTGAIQGAKRIGRDWIIPAKYTSGTEEIDLSASERDNTER
jgi:Helix-turn-helix domain